MTKTYEKMDICWCIYAILYAALLEKCWYSGVLPFATHLFLRALAAYQNVENVDVVSIMGKCLI